jgi:hypothetical protein
LPARRCQRVAFSIFLCFFLRMRLRRFLISDPMAGVRVAGRRSGCRDPLSYAGARVSSGG